MRCTRRKILFGILRHTMKSLLPVFCLTLVLLGCDRASEDVPYYRLPDSAVVAAVGDARCTKADVQRNEEIMSKIVSLCGTAAKVDPAVFRRNYTTAFVVQAILVREAKRRGRTLSDKDFDRQQKRFLASIPGRTSLTYEQTVSSLGSLASTFEANQRQEALANEMEEILRAEFAKKAAAASSFATNAWKSIRAGNDFDVVGKKLVEMGKDVSYEAECEPPTGILAELSAGAVSPLTAIEGGLSIWKAKTNVANKMAYSRIFFAISSVDAAFDAWMEDQKKTPDVILKIK